MVDVVIAVAQVEVEYADGVHLLDVVIVFAYLQLFDDGLRSAEQDALHEVRLTCQLHLNKDNLTR